MFVNEFLNTVSKYNMINKTDSILVGLSGGADSVCLLLNLLELGKTMGINVSAVHIHHGIRGKEADRDAEFCKRLCEGLDIEFRIEYVDAVSFAKQNKLSVEEGARELRYGVFKKYSDGKKIAAAHNLSDNAETMLINIIRGTGLKGLCGIPAVRDNIIRPLLFTSRQDIEGYLKQKNQEYMTDSTNLSSDYTRNKIRINIIPEILNINNSFYKTSARNKIILEQEESFLEEYSQEAYRSAQTVSGLIISKLLDMHPAVRSRCISIFIKNNGLTISSEKVNDVISILPEGKINYSKNVYITAKSGILSIEKETKYLPVNKKFDLGETSFYDKTVMSEIISSEKFNKNDFVHKNFANYYADYGKIQGDVVIRSRCNGDRFKLPSRDFTSSVKKLLQAEIPKQERQKLVFLEDRDGVIFIERFGFTERVKADCDTKEVLLLTIK